MQYQAAKSSVDRGHPATMPTTHSVNYLQQKMFSLDRGTPAKCHHLKRIICCIDEMEVSSLVPDPEAVALPTHADGEVAPWQSHLHKPPVDNSQVKKCDIQPSLVSCPQFCHILPRTGPLTSSIPYVNRACLILCKFMNYPTWRSDILTARTGFE